MTTIQIADKPTLDRIESLLEESAGGVFKSGQMINVNVSGAAIETILLNASNNNGGMFHMMSVNLTGNGSTLRLVVDGNLYPDDAKAMFGPAARIYFSKSIKIYAEYVSAAQVYTKVLKGFLYLN